MPKAELEFVLNRTFDSYARRLERKNLREHSHSPAATSIGRAAYSYIVEIQDDRHGMLIRIGWREAMREAAKVES